ncbi:lantibiotic dehydratase [Archangium sp.]|uniref:lantibiotic dehydratase n=1 Tax=Archangium sp. TaxID=1872627 RepID=UPI00286B5B0E|nr:lantibiotic dehydratase [Archangium sp.]
MTERRPPAPPPYQPAGFFALRTPLLPFDVLEAWGQELEAPRASPETLEEALRRDRVRLRERLRQWVADPVVREALFIASPVLEESLPVWLEAPESERGQKVERTVVRYFARMAGRATPFGLFAGMSLGRLGAHTRLRLCARSALKRHTRLDMDYVCALVEQVRKAPEVRRALRYVPNSSLYRSAGRLRYMDLRLQGRERSYHLVAVEPSPYLEATLERARGGATVEELAGALVAADADIGLDEARAYLDELVETQLLVPTWAPTVTGPEPVPFLLEHSRDIPALAPVRERLASVHEALGRIDASAPGVPAEAYREVARMLEGLPTPAELPRLFQVDMFRPALEASLSHRVVDEARRSFEALHRITSRSDVDGPLERFRRRFQERYEGRAVPLLEALDEESGLGFEREGVAGAGTGPLLQGFAFPQPEGEERTRTEPRWRHLLKRLEETWRQGAQALVLTAEDLGAMEARETLPLPESFGVAGTVVASCAEAVDRGDFRLVLENVYGPSGATYLGRFCHGDPELEAATRDYLRAEEALRPEAIFAELVHLPHGRMGNVICRPALRRYDLVFLGQSGVPEADRLELTDLWLSVERGRLVLRSRKLGREVIPRLTNAHNYATLGLSLYRFLGQLQRQGVQTLAFGWGPLAKAPFLPRVVYGRTVLSLARWNVGPRVLEAWGRAKDAERFQAVQRFRHEARLPRWVCLQEGDNQLPIDLDNALSVDTLVHLVRNRSGGVVLEELYPGPGELCVEGGDGRYVNEVVVPFLRSERLERPSSREAPSPTHGTRRQFPPGSEWLYAKLYTGTATADRLLRTTLAEALRSISATGAVDRWFFIRYGDPDWHLRLRLHGEPRSLHAEVLPLLQEACASALDAGEASRLQLDTYEREVERYGGPEGMELAEQLFTADSEAVLELLQAYPGDEGADLRWRLGLRGLDALLDDLGLSLEEKATVAERCRAGFGTELHVDGAFEEQLGQRYRRESKPLESLLALEPPATEPWGAGLEALRRRSERLRPVAERLRLAEREGRLTLSVTGLAESFLHMHINRLLMSDHRAQELILYDFLDRLYRSRLARRRKGT